MLAFLHLSPIVWTFKLLACETAHPVAYLALALLTIELVALLFHCSFRLITMWVIVRFRFGFLM